MPEPSNPKIIYRDIKIEYKMWTHHSQTRESRWCLQPPSQSAPNLTTRHSGRTTASSSLKVLLNKVLMTLLCYLFQPGAEFHADLPEPQPENVLRKGTNPEVDHSSLWWQICCLVTLGISLRSTPTQRSLTTRGRKVQAAQDWPSRFPVPLRFSYSWKVDCYWGQFSFELVGRHHAQNTLWNLIMLYFFCKAQGPRT